MTFKYINKWLSLAASAVGSEAVKYKHQYLISVVTAGETIEVYKTQSSRYGYNIPRNNNISSTPEAMAENNKRMAKNTLRQVLNGNFKDGDMHAVFKYFKHLRPKTREQALDDIKRWVRRIRPQLSKLGIPLKYVYAVGIGERGAVHMHVVLNEMPIKLIQKYWCKGSVYFTSLYTEGQYRELANYIIEQTDDWQYKRELGERRYTTSANVKKPVPKKRAVKAKTWHKKPKPPKGYIFDPTFPIENGECTVTGLTYQRYGLIKIKEYQPRTKRLQAEARH